MLVATGILNKARQPTGYEVFTKYDITRYEATCEIFSKISVRNICILTSDTRDEEECHQDDI